MQNKSWLLMHWKLLEELRTMNELTKACECVPRSGIPNNFPAATLLSKNDINMKKSYSKCMHRIMKTLMLCVTSAKNKEKTLNVQGIQLWSVMYKCQVGWNMSICATAEICKEQLPCCMESSHVAIPRCPYSTIRSLNFKTKTLLLMKSSLIQKIQMWKS